MKYLCKSHLYMTKDFVLIETIHIFDFEYNRKKKLILIIHIVVRRVCTFTFTLCRKRKCKSKDFFSYVHTDDNKNLIFFFNLFQRKSTISLVILILLFIIDTYLIKKFINSITFTAKMKRKKISAIES